MTAAAFESRGPCAAYLQGLGAKDAGKDPLTEHLQGRGLHVARWEDVFDIPVVKRRPDVSDDDRLPSIMEYLMRRGAQRPVTMKTLQGSVASLFQPKLEDEDAPALVKQLRLNGVLEVVGTKVKYGLPGRRHCQWSLAL